MGLRRFCNQSESVSIWESQIQDSIWVSASAIKRNCFSSDSLYPRGPKNSLRGQIWIFLNIGVECYCSGVHFSSSAGGAQQDYEGFRAVGAWVVCQLACSYGFVQMSLFPGGGKEKVLGRKLKELEAWGKGCIPLQGQMFIRWSPRAFSCKRSLLSSGRSAFTSFKGRG